MPINLIFSILYKLKFGKKDVPRVEVDKPEHLILQSKKQTLSNVKKANDKLKKSKKIYTVYIEDSNFLSKKQVYKLIYDIASQHINKFNGEASKIQKAKKNNKLLVYIMLIAIVGVGLYFIYKYWTDVKKKFSKIYGYISSFVSKLKDYAIWAIKYLFKHIKIFFGKVFDNIKDFTIKVYNETVAIIKLIIVFIGEALTLAFNTLVVKPMKNLITTIEGYVKSILSWDIVTILSGIWPLKWFTSSFKQKDEKDDKNYASEGLEDVEKDNSPAYFDSFDKEENKITNDKNTKEATSALNGIDSQQIVTNEILQSIDLSKKIVKTQKASDALYISPNTKLIVNKYTKFKAAITSVNDSLNSKINDFQSTVDENIKNWKEFLLA